MTIKKMALPKNKNLRKVVVDNITYYWRISSQDMINHDLIVVIGLVDDPNKRFYLKFKHIDHFDVLGTPEYEELKEFKNEIDIVTPKHIERAIRTSLKNNWTEMSYKDVLNIRLQGGKYIREI